MSRIKFLKRRLIELYLNGDVELKPRCQLAYLEE